MTDSNDEWELSKENIQPIQQGRKQKVLKVALAPHPEDLISQERHAFEHELRTYSGSDPLSVWCKYIKWVEQNFPKGGREGHIKQLIERCLAILKEEKGYYDDQRFIDIMFKFSNINGKSLDVFNYMYSHNIGCKSAKFFITWSWELEQLGNMKKADEVLTEGIQRQAEPFENMQAYRKEFEMRLLCKIKESTNNVDYELGSGRSAFTMLKPQKKKLAPVSRIGESVVDKKNPLLIGRQLPQPKKASAHPKVPFRIYNSENVAPSLPVQTQTVATSILHSVNYKENEQKPGKWNKVKVKPRVQNVRAASEENPGFKFHCDDENGQESCTPISVPKTSNILSTKCRTPSPVMALFEPLDPLKKAMYPKNKVYGGVEEYSLEEIRAAQWLDRHKKKQQEFILEEQKRQIQEQAKKNKDLEKEINKLTNQMKMLQSNCVIPATKQGKLFSAPTETYSNENTGNIKSKEGDNSHQSGIENKPITDFKTDVSSSRQASLMSSNDEIKETLEGQFSFSKHLYKSNNGATDTFDTKTIDSTRYREAAKMEDLYNWTLTHSADNSDYRTNTDSNFDFKSAPTSSADVPYLTSENHVEDPVPNLKELKNDLPFSFFRDPTEIVPNPVNVAPPVLVHPSETQMSNFMENERLEKKEHKNDFPFMFYSNPIEEVHQSVQAVVPTRNPAAYSQENIAARRPVTVEKEDSFEDVENIPPKGYMQEKSKRELAGILEPSKNIYFIPLEEQEDVQDDSDVDVICQPGDQYADETLIPPSNTEQFSAYRFLASTPCASRNNKAPHLIDSKCENELPISNVPQKNCSVETDNLEISDSKNLVSVQPLVPKVKEISVKEPGINPCLTKVLSVIMETSSENYSKSSSSSSSSVNLTKSGQLDPSHFSSIRKPFTRHETLSSVVEVPDSTFQDSSHRNDKITHKVKNIVDVSRPFNLHTVDFDPFDNQETCKHLKSVDFSEYKNLYNVNKSLRSLKIGEILSLGETNYRVECLIAEGAYAKVYQAIKLFSINHDLSLSEKIALKVCKNSNEWEFYICFEVQKRLANLNRLPNVKYSFMNVTSALRFSDGIVLVNEYNDRGTMLDVINFYKKKNSLIPETIVMYLTLDILHIVSRLHEVNIIHGDIKPDNFLILKDAFDCDILKHVTESVTSLSLIDFGRAIDLNHYNKGICFTTTFSSSYFQCIEMKENKPWVFQLDWYGVLICIHTMLFNEYMSVRKKNDRWEIQKKFKRYWFTELWESLFSEILNIPECYQEPNIKKYIDMIETKLQQSSQNFILELKRHASLYSESKMFV